jgi:glycosyltransferase involved in cell wall biosynthesis
VCLIERNLVDIAIIRTNSIFRDPRLVKIIRSLDRKYSILVLGWNREGMKFNGKVSLNEISYSPHNNYDSDLNLLNLKAPFAKSSLIDYTPLIGYFPFFWTWVLVKLIYHRPKIVHSCDLDTLIPCLIYKLIFRKKMIFDVFDRYAMTFIPRKFRTLYSMINTFEELFGEKADVLVTVSEKLLNTFRRKPKNCVIIMNCIEDHMLNIVKAKANGFRILFTGHIRPGRGLEILPDVLKDLKDTQLIIAGRIEDRKLLNKVNEIPNIRYQGFLDLKEVLDLEASSDVMIALYDLNLRIQNKYAMGNKLFEAMMLGVPIISNVSQELIKELDCGIVVDYHNVDQIRETIIKLRDNPELRKRLGDNGRKAFLEKYNWNKMEQRLYEIYDGLLSKSS